MTGFWTRHARFVVAFLLGLALAILAPLSPGMRALLGANSFFATYLGLSLLHARRVTPDDLRRHGAQDDEGAGLIFAMASFGIAASLWAILDALRGGASGVAWQTGLAVASVPLGWATLHMVMGFHYARLFYARDAQGQPRGGLIFAGDATAPGIWDFLYFSFTLGMTAQTSDTGVATAGLRRVVLIHSVASFFYNTVILALAVNAAISLGASTG